MDKQITRRELIRGAAATAAAVGVFDILPAGARGANERISIGMVGVGGRGGSLLAELGRVADEHNARIGAVCETWTQRRKAAARQAAAINGGDECREFVDYREMLQGEVVDAVVIATPDFAHGPVLVDALKAGKDVYVEKPMTNELSEASEAVDLAAEKKLVVQVGTQRRSDGLWQAAARAVQSGVLGKISHVEVGWNDNSPRWRKAKPDITQKDVDWKRYLLHLKPREFDWRFYREWHFYRELTNGPIALLGAHYLDVAAWFLNDPYPTSAVALGGRYVWDDGREHEDTVTALLEYPSGCLVSYVTRLGNGAGPVCRVSGLNGAFTEAPFEITGSGGAPGAAIKEKLPLQPEPGEAHTGNWLRCIRTREKPNAPVETGHQHVAACCLAYEALLSGRKMRYDARRRRIAAG